MPIETLSLVGSISRKTADSHRNLQDYLIHFNGRLQTLARSRATGIFDMELMILDEIQIHCAAEHDRVSTKGPSIQLNRQAGMLLALGIHELAENAVKFGALTVPGGHVNVTWSRSGSGAGEHLRLHWKETGVPLAEEEPIHEGFGFYVLREWLSRELDARTKIEFRDQGLYLTSRIPWRHVEPVESAE